MNLTNSSKRLHVDVSNRQREAEVERLWDLAQICVCHCTIRHRSLRGGGSRTTGIRCDNSSCKFVKIDLKYLVLCVRLGWGDGLFNLRSFHVINVKVLIS